MDVESDQLKKAVEDMHNCSARLIQSVPVKESFARETVWEGVVHVFDLEGHPKATRGYAWSSPIERSTKRRFFAGLYIPPIESPIEAVRAAIVAEHRARMIGNMAVYHIVIIAAVVTVVLAANRHARAGQAECKDAIASYNSRAGGNLVRKQ